MKTKRKENVSSLSYSLVISALLGCAITASAEENFKMQIHSAKTSGTWALEHQKYREAIAFLEFDKAHADRGSRNWRPILTNLCVAYTKVGDYKTASDFCDYAVEADTKSGIAYNNRGVLAALKGDHAAAAADFEAAREHGGAAEYTTHNTQRLGEHVSEYRGDIPARGVQPPVS